MEAKKQAGRSPAACFAEWPFSDPAMRSNPQDSVRRKLQILRFAASGKVHSFRCGSFSHANRFAGFMGPRRGRTPHQYVGGGLVPARGRPRGPPLR